MTDTPDKALREALERSVMRGEFNRLTNVLKDAHHSETQPREPAGTPEGGQFASSGGGGGVAGAARTVGSAVAGAGRAVGRGVAAVRNSRVVQFARNAAFMVRLNRERRRHDVPQSQRAIIASALVAGGDGVRREMAQRAATAAALAVAAPESNVSVSLSPRNTSALHTPYWHKAEDDDDGGWFVNRHGVLFAVVNDLYFAVDTARVPELSDLEPGDYTHAEIAELIAEDDDD